MTRAFVVGNGPSLAHTELDKLIGEVSFACNNVNLAYQNTSWRPTHYVRAEQAYGLEPQDWMESMEVHLDLDCEVWCNPYFLKHVRSRGRVFSINGCAHYAVNFDESNVPYHWHLPSLCTFGSTVNVAIQIAAQQGYAPIYLVGCDLGYKDNQPSHFDPSYEHGNEQPARYANMNTMMAHIIAARTGAVEILNATKGGSLEVYERVDYDALFN